MTKFKAGDMITGELEMSDGTKELKAYYVNSILVDDSKYSFFKGQEFYSLDNGDGWTDIRALCRVIDATFETSD